jgi:hypothetical protein
MVEVPKIKRILQVKYQEKTPSCVGFHSVLFEICGEPSKKKALMIATLFDDPQKFYVIYNVSALKKMKEPKPWVNENLHWQHHKGI